MLSCSPLSGTGMILLVEHLKGHEVLTSFHSLMQDWQNSLLHKLQDSGSLQTSKQIVHRKFSDRFWSVNSDGSNPIYMNIIY
jgi:hypothetical protein